VHLHDSEPHKPHSAGSAVPVAGSTSPFSGDVISGADRCATTLMYPIQDAQTDAEGDETA
jgi:hypothetical protein